MRKLVVAHVKYYPNLLWPKGKMAKVQKHGLEIYPDMGTNQGMTLRKLHNFFTSMVSVLSLCFL